LSADDSSHAARPVIVFLADEETLKFRIAAIDGTARSKEMSFYV